MARALRWTLLLVLSVFAHTAFADEAADRAAIDALIAALNNHTQPSSNLFTGDSADIQRELANLAAASRPSGGPLSEVSEPHITVRSVRFITSDVALVDATSDQFGSTLPVRRIPVLLILKKDANWRIAAVRISAISDAPRLN
jgi:hypothetical protein